MMDDEAETTGGDDPETSASGDGDSARRPGTAILPVNGPDGRERRRPSAPAETDGYREGRTDPGEPD